MSGSEIVWVVVVVVVATAAWLAGKMRGKWEEMERTVEEWNDIMEQRHRLEQEWQTLRAAVFKHL